MSGPEMDDDVSLSPGVVPGGRVRSQLSTAGVVHDLGNLIQVASSALNHLAREPSISAVPGIDIVIAGARTALDRAGGLVRQTIKTAREIQGDVEHANISVCLVEIESFVRSARYENVRFEFRVDSNLPLVRCDRAGLQNAVLNLVFNARDAMPDGGLISIDAFAPESLRQVAIRIRDSGIGMTGETVVRAFDPFFTTKGGGFGGVGLPMVKRFAEESGGSVHIESVLGMGTTVTLRLPATS